MKNYEPSTVADLLARSVRAAPDACAIEDAAGSVLTYAELSDRVAALAAQLAVAAPLRHGRRRIGIVLPNGAALTVALLAASIAGEAAPFNPALTKEELTKYFDHMQISALLLSHDDTSEAADLAPLLGIVVLRLTNENGIPGVARDGPAPAPQPDDIAMVLLTSGSTGLPKIVPLSHRNVCRSASDVAQSVALGSEDRCLVMWQQFHIGGLVDLLLAPLLSGGTLIVTRGFDTIRFFELLASARPTWFQGVPTTLGELVQHAVRHDMVPRDSSLRFIRSVAAALTPTLKNQIADLFGVPVVRTLGMTEASPLITSTALPPAMDRDGSVGRPCGPEVRVFGPAMTVLDPEQIGEIAIRGENVFGGYENNAEANKLAFRDGWFFTGDNGFIDAEGYLFLTGRAKEQINRGGYKIMPSEVEEALSRHPAVHEAVVFGVPHATLGEDVAAAVSLREGATVDVATLRTHLSSLLAVNKVPGRITILPELPRNPVGKIDRLALAQAAATATDTVIDQQGPRDAMERFLTELWSRELALTEVGIHQEFVTIGGDSLSALRIVVAMEAVFGRPMPDDLFTGLQTIAETSAALSSAGFSLETDGDDVIGTARRALDATLVGTEDLQGKSGFSDALRSARNETDLETAFEGLTVYETPADISTVLRGIDLAHVAPDAPAPFRYLLRRRFRQNADDILADIGAAGSAALRWRRADLNLAALHFGDPTLPLSEKTLIVGFSGKLLRLQLPSFRILLHLDPSRFDLLLLRDASHRLFAEGLPGMGNSLMELGAWVDDFATAGRYSRRIAMGTSGGGLAAIHTGLAFGWDRAVAASAPSPVINAILGQTLAELAAKPGHEQTNLLIVHGRNARDLGPAQELMRLFPFARHDLREEYTSHNVLASAHKAGKLGRLFEDWFN